MAGYPYADRFEVHDRLPADPVPREEVLRQLSEMAVAEDARWEEGQCSGTMYCGDHEHYGFLGEAFGRFAHVNALQRDMCPSQTKFEAEIIAMTAALLGGGDREPVGLVTSGGTGSIAHAMLAYREAAAPRTSQPNVIKPETAHPAFNKACHLFGIELRTAPVDPVTTQVDVDWVADHVDAGTVAIIGSACNYGYGTIDPIESLAALAVDRGVGLQRRRAASGGSSCRSGASSASRSRRSTCRSRASRACRRTRTSTGTRSRARACSSSRTEPCATRSTST